MFHTETSVQTSCISYPSLKREEKKGKWFELGDEYNIQHFLLFEGKKIF